jgi:hypothetical protein
MTYWQMFWVTLGSVLTFVLLLILLLISGSRYPVSKVEDSAIDYGGAAKEGHGTMTTFLWVTFSGMFVWTIIYFVLHWHEFAIITAYAK